MTSVGSYARVDSTARSWLHDPITIVNKGNKQAKVHEKVYPQFTEMSNLTTSSEWKDIFNNASEGRLPKNFGISGSTLFYFNKNKQSKVTIPTDAYQALNVCQDFFREMGGVASKDDPIDSTSDTTTYHPEPVNVTWATITSKQQKKLHIINFIEKLKTKYDLTPEETLNLKKAINTWMVLDYLNNTVVVIVDRNIDRIIGLEFDKNTRKFTLDASEHKRVYKKKSTKSKPPVNIFEKLWIKYLNSYRPDKKTDILVLDTNLQ